MRRLKISRRNWVVKHTEGMCGVGKWLFIWEDSETDACPLCAAPEDARHVWLCPDHRAQVLRDKGLSSVNTWMESAQTDPGIQRAIMGRLSQLLSLQPLTPIANLPLDVQTALQSQDEIGWMNFFEGCLAHEWEDVQSNHYSWCRSRKSSRRWTTSLIRKLWDISWDLWEHRIGILHDASNAEILYNMAEVNDSIRDQFWHGPQGLPPRDHALFSGTVEQLLSASIPYRQKWLERVEKARARATRRALTSHDQERQALRAWLHGPPAQSANSNEVT
jgi:hypothetical protein